MDVTWSSLQLDDPKKVADVEKYVGGFRLSDDTLKQVQEIFLNEMKLGLSKDESKRKQSSCVMESTYLRDTLHGKEEGDFLALDLGGTRFRILLVRLHNHQYSEIFKVADIPDAILVGSGDQLFAYIADRIFDFLEENNLHGQKFPLGFTFSFPMIQKSLNCGILITWTKSFKCSGSAFPMIQKSLKCGILITWTKSFKCSGCVGEDAVKHLENAIKIRGGMDIEVVAIVNDTTGTLMAGAYLDEKCRVGVILGTGFNACYVEKLENVEKWDGDYEEPRQVLIDTEMGAFGDNGVLDFFKTEYDFEVDQVSNHVHSFTFEKMFSGHYLGEVVRLTMLKLISEGLLFGGTSSNEINQRWGLKTEHVAFIDGEKTDENTRNLLKEMKLLEHGGKDDIAIIKHVCALVSERGGFLVGSCMAVLLNRMQEPDVTIAVDGSVYKHHARLHQLIMRKIEQFAPKYKCKIIRADDGSGSQKFYQQYKRKAVSNQNTHIRQFYMTFILITWTKSFKCSGCVGEDAVKHLENAIKIRGGMDIEVVAIVNDTTGTLMAGAYLDEKCRVGVILGTGFNACYVEKLENVEKWDGDYEEPRQVLIDTEMGAFGDNGVLDFFKTEYDFEVDQVSNHVHSFTFEKMFSGHYLGEVVRLTMLKLISEGLLFGGTSSNEINQRWGLKTEHVAFIDGEKTDENTRNLLKEMKLLEHGGKDDIAIIKHVCALVSERGGFLVGSCMAVLLNRMQEPDVTIAVDGSVYKHHARLHQLIMRKIEQFAPKYKCKIIRADDGSGKGAGLVAAVAVRLEKERQRHMAAVAAN
ncbi:PREDICTED: hexokinase-1-like [Priapulus caudatus]|uniref:hexokinase n=1 Tax=Priapulus caudatus TaxID=37621 RepID=A0ABM1DTW1_PRICU|nr:PREDICTED: hexokinase-1-like [Priapulus caudatus]